MESKIVIRCYLALLFLIIDGAQRSSSSHIQISHPAPKSSLQSKSHAFQDSILESAKFEIARIDDKFKFPEGPALLPAFGVYTSSKDFRPIPKVGDQRRSFPKGSSNAKSYSGKAKVDRIPRNDFSKSKGHKRISTKSYESEEEPRGPPDHVIPYSEHEVPREVPTKPKYEAPGEWAKPPANRNISLDFVPSKLYAQVRGTHTVKHLPQEEAGLSAETEEEKANAPRLREVVTNSKVNTVYSEEGYEDAAYDHGGHIRDADFNEDYAKKLHDLRSKEKKSPSFEIKNGRRKEPPIKYEGAKGPSTWNYGDDSREKREESKVIESSGEKIIEQNDTDDWNEFSKRNNINPKIVTEDAIQKLRRDLERETEEAEKDSGSYGVEESRESQYSYESDYEQVPNTPSKEDKKGVNGDGTAVKSISSEQHSGKSSSPQNEEGTTSDAPETSTVGFQPREQSQLYDRVTSTETVPQKYREPYPTSSSTEEYKLGSQPGPYPDTSTRRYDSVSPLYSTYSTKSPIYDGSPTLSPAQVFWKHYQAIQALPKVPVPIYSATTAKPYDQQTPIALATINGHGPYLLVVGDQDASLPPSTGEVHPTQSTNAYSSEYQGNDQRWSAPNTTPSTYASPVTVRTYRDDSVVSAKIYQPKEVRPLGMTKAIPIAYSNVSNTSKLGLSAVPLSTGQPIWNMDYINNPFLKSYVHGSKNKIGERSTAEPTRDYASKFRSIEGTSAKDNTYSDHGDSNMNSNVRFNKGGNSNSGGFLIAAPFKSAETGNYRERDFSDEYRYEGGQRTPGSLSISESARKEPVNIDSTRQSDFAFDSKYVNARSPASSLISKPPYMKSVESATFRQRDTLLAPKFVKNERNMGSTSNFGSTYSIIPESYLISGNKYSMGDKSPKSFTRSGSEDIKSIVAEKFQQQEFKSAPKTERGFESPTGNSFSSSKAHPEFKNYKPAIIPEKFQRSNVSSNYEKVERGSINSTDYEAPNFESREYQSRDDVPDTKYRKREKTSGDYSDSETSYLKSAKSEKPEQSNLPSDSEYLKGTKNSGYRSSAESKYSDEENSQSKETPIFQQGDYRSTSKYFKTEPNSRDPPSSEFSNSSSSNSKIIKPERHRQTNSPSDSDYVKSRKNSGHFSSSEFTPAGRDKSKNENYEQSVPKFNSKYEGKDRNSGYHSNSGHSSSSEFAPANRDKSKNENYEQSVPTFNSKYEGKNRNSGYHSNSGHSSSSEFTPANRDKSKNENYEQSVPKFNSKYEGKDKNSGYHSNSESTNFNSAKVENSEESDFTFNSESAEEGKRGGRYSNSKSTYPPPKETTKSHTREFSPDDSRIKYKSIEEGSSLESVRSKSPETKRFPNYSPKYTKHEPTSTNYSRPESPYFEKAENENVRKSYGKNEGSSEDITSTIPPYFDSSSIEKPIDNDDKRTKVFKYLENESREKFKESSTGSKYDWPERESTLNDFPASKSQPLNEVYSGSLVTDSYSSIADFSPKKSESGRTGEGRQKPMFSPRVSANNFLKPFSSPFTADGSMVKATFPIIDLIPPPASADQRGYTRYRRGKFPTGNSFQGELNHRKIFRPSPSVSRSEFQGIPNARFSKIDFFSDEHDDDLFDFAHFMNDKILKRKKRGTRIESLEVTTAEAEIAHDTHDMHDSTMGVIAHDTDTRSDSETDREKILANTRVRSKRNLISEETHQKRNNDLEVIRSEGREKRSSSTREELLEEAPKVVSDVIDKEINERFEQDSEEEDHEERGKVEVEVPGYNFAEEIEDDGVVEVPTTVNPTKYPYYRDQMIPKTSALKYILNPRSVPQKTLGGMEFYESRDRYMLCDDVDANLEDVVPEEQELGRDDQDMKENLPRLRGLGDKLDCFKAKYFDENPFDNPLFIEKEVALPGPPEELDYVGFAAKVKSLPKERQEYIAQKLSKAPETEEGLNKHMKAKRRINCRTFRFPKDPEKSENLHEEPCNSEKRSTTLRIKKPPRKNVRNPKELNPRVRQKTGGNAESSTPKSPYQNEVYEDVMVTIKNLAFLQPMFADPKIAPLNKASILTPKYQKSAASFKNTESLNYIPNSLRGIDTGFPLIDITESPRVTDIEGLVPPPVNSKAILFRPNVPSSLKIKREKHLEFGTVPEAYRTIRIYKRSVDDKDEDKENVEDDDEDELEDASSDSEDEENDGDSDEHGHLHSIRKRSVQSTKQNLQIEDTGDEVTSAQAELEVSTWSPLRRRQKIGVTTAKRSATTPIQPKNPTTTATTPITDVTTLNASESNTQKTVYTIWDRYNRMKKAHEIGKHGQFTTDASATTDIRRKEPRYNYIRRRKPPTSTTTSTETSSTPHLIEDDQTSVVTTEITKLPVKTTTPESVETTTSGQLDYWKEYNDWEKQRNPHKSTGDPIYTQRVHGNSDKNVKESNKKRKDHQPIASHPEDYSERNRVESSQIHLAFEEEPSDEATPRSYSYSPTSRPQSDENSSEYEFESSENPYTTPYFRNASQISKSESSRKEVDDKQGYRQTTPFSKNYSQSSKSGTNRNRFEDAGMANRYPAPFSRNYSNSNRSEINSRQEERSKQKESYPTSSSGNYSKTSKFEGSQSPFPNLKQKGRYPTVSSNYSQNITPESIRSRGQQATQKKENYHTTPYSNYAQSSHSESQQNDVESESSEEDYYQTTPYSEGNSRTNRSRNDGYGSKNQRVNYYTTPYPDNSSEHSPSPNERIRVSVDRSSEEFQITRPTKGYDVYEDVKEDPTPSPVGLLHPSRSTPYSSTYHPSSTIRSPEDYTRGFSSTSSTTSDGSKKYESGRYSTPSYSSNQESSESSRDSSSERFNKDGDDSSRESYRYSSKEYPKGKHSEKDKPYFTYSSRPSSPAESGEDEKYSKLGSRIRKPNFVHPPFKVPWEFNDDTSPLKKIRLDSDESVSISSAESKGRGDFSFDWKFDDNGNERKTTLPTSIGSYEFPWEREKKKGRSSKIKDDDDTFGKSKLFDDDSSSNERKGKLFSWDSPAKKNTKREKNFPKDSLFDSDESTSSFGPTVKFSSKYNKDRRKSKDESSIFDSLESDEKDFSGFLKEEPSEIVTGRSVKPPSKLLSLESFSNDKSSDVLTSMRSGNKDDSFEVFSKKPSSDMASFMKESPLNAGSSLSTKPTFMDSSFEGFSREVPSKMGSSTVGKSSRITMVNDDSYEGISKSPSEIISHIKDDTSFMKSDSDNAFKGFSRDMSSELDSFPIKSRSKTINFPATPRVTSKNTSMMKERRPIVQSPVAEDNYFESTSGETLSDISKSFSMKYQNRAPTPSSMSLNKEKTMAHSSMFPTKSSANENFYSGEKSFELSTDFPTSSTNRGYSYSSEESTSYSTSPTRKFLDDSRRIPTTLSREKVTFEGFPKSDPTLNNARFSSSSISRDNSYESTPRMTSSEVVTSRFSRNPSDKEDSFSTFSSVESPYRTPTLQSTSGDRRDYFSNFFKGESSQIVTSEPVTVPEYSTFNSTPYTSAEYTTQRSTAYDTLKNRHFLGSGIIPESITMAPKNRTDVRALFRNFRTTTIGPPPETSNEDSSSTDRLRSVPASTTIRYYPRFRGRPMSSPSDTYQDTPTNESAEAPKSSEEYEKMYPMKARRHWNPKNATNSASSESPTAESSTLPKFTIRRRVQPVASTPPTTSSEYPLSTSSSKEVDENRFSENSFFDDSTFDSIGTSDNDESTYKDPTPASRTVEHRSRVSKEEIITKTYYPDDKSFPTSRFFHRNQLTTESPEESSRQERKFASMEEDPIANESMEKVSILTKETPDHVYQTKEINKDGVRGMYVSIVPTNYTIAPTAINEELRANDPDIEELKRKMEAFGGFEDSADDPEDNLDKLSGSESVLTTDNIAATTRSTSIASGSDKEEIEEDSKEENSMQRSLEIKDGRWNETDPNTQTEGNEDIYPKTTDKHVKFTKDPSQRLYYYVE